MRTYPNHGLTETTFFRRGVEIINLDAINLNNTGGNYFEMREASVPVLHKNQYHCLVTCVRLVRQRDTSGNLIRNSHGQVLYPGKPDKNKKDFVEEHSLHRFLCPDASKPEKWDYKGRIMLWGEYGEMQGEDATFVITDTGEIYLLCENKTREKAERVFTIAKFVAKDWNSKFIFDAKAEFFPFGNGRAKDALYSPEHIDKHIDPIYFDGRKGRHEENIFYAKWKDGKLIPDPEPVFTVEDISQPIKSEDDSKILTTGIGGIPYKIEKEDGSIWYIMKIVAYKDWSREIWLKGLPELYNGYWCQGFAISKSLRSGWEELNSEIKDQDGKNIIFNIFYSNGWKAMMGYVNDPTKRYLGEAVTGSTPTPINGGNMKPVITLKDNKLTCEPYPNAVDYMWHSQEEMDRKGNPYFGREISIDVPDRLKVEGKDFWVYCKLADGGKSPDSNRVGYGGTTPAPIRGCMDKDALNYNSKATEHVQDMCEYAPSPNFDKGKVLTSCGIIRGELDKIEAEVNKA